MRKKWSNSEIAILKKYYPTKGSEWVRKKLNRSESSVRWKISALGLVANFDLRKNLIKENLKSKTCTKCKKEKPVDCFLFNRHMKSGRDSWCKECRNVAKRNMPSEYKRKQNLKNAFGITIEQYDKMFEAQNGVCAICGEPEIAKNQYGIRRLAVDHNHKTKKTRGLLCLRCNNSLGSLRVDEKGIELLLKAIEYTRKCDG